MKAFDCNPACIWFWAKQWRTFAAHISWVYDIPWYVPTLFDMWNPKTSFWHTSPSSYALWVLDCIFFISGLVLGIFGNFPAAVGPLLQPSDLVRSWNLRRKQKAFDISRLDEKTGTIQIVKANFAFAKDHCTASTLLQCGMENEKPYATGNCLPMRMLEVSKTTFLVSVVSHGQVSLASKWECQCQTSHVSSCLIVSSLGFSTSFAADAARVLGSVWAMPQRCSPTMPTDLSRLSPTMRTKMNWPFG